MTQPSPLGPAKRAQASQVGGLRRFWRDNALSIVVLGCFLLFWFGQSVAGLDSYNQDRLDHGQNAITYWHYLRTSHFWEATSENWESEFLQMGFFVILTVYLKQRGSAESNPYPDEKQGQEQASSSGGQAGRRAGLLYRNSLSIALLALFAVSFAVHVVSGALEYSQEQLEHGQKAVSAWQFLFTPDLWFQSLQNWQSEFLSIGMMVLLTIWLRQEGSSQSKDIGVPDRHTSDA